MSHQRALVQDPSEKGIPMSTSPEAPQPQPAAKNQNRRKKARVIMASGLVLGIGAAVTLAAWSDTVWGSGTFGTEGNAFNTQGSFDGGTDWKEHVSSTGTGDNGPGAMSFAQNANALIPGVPVYQLVGLHEAEGNLGADIVLKRTNADTSALKDVVKVAVADAGTGETAPACGAGTTFGAPVTIGAPASQMLTTDIAADGYRWVCFSATLDDKATPAVSNKVSQPILWEFAATSKNAPATPTATTSPANVR
ncbi:SipW-dependent-type signal peptide-containing protein [Dietzia lutea]|uniref:SipW-dependent-type signal peptide-containing protein n=2 Tax=Dietzia lutea TaxID=546160 RepID=UPI0013A5371E|nr:SipW-dependent-type signal peptide-containing protein [Dietzia lutea]